MFDITIENKKYEFITCIKINNIDYVAYKDDKDTYISEYKIINNKIEFNSVSNENIEEIRKAMGL